MLKIFMITTRVEGDTTKLREELSKNKNVQVLEYYSEKDYLHTLLSKESFDESVKVFL